MESQLSTADIMEQVAERSKKLYANKISYRSKTESKMSQIFDVYDSLTPELKKTIKEPESRDCKVAFSSLYDEPFDQKLYDKQLKDWQSFVRKLHALAKKLDEEAREKAIQYLEMTKEWI